jgi:hypothetical protein
MSKKSGSYCTVATLRKRRQGNMMEISGKETILEY